MPVPAGSPLNPEATKAKVLHAAAELFYQRGVHGVGVNDIAAKASASKLSIYRYFGSKEGLVAAVVTSRSDEFHTWLHQELADLPPGRDRILALFDRLTDWFAEPGYQGCAVVNLVIDTRGTDDAVRGTVRHHLARYRQMLEDELTASGLAHPTPLARQLLVLSAGAATAAVVAGDPHHGRDAHDAAEALLDAARRTSAQ